VKLLYYPDTSYTPTIHKFIYDFVNHLEGNGSRESVVVTLAHRRVSKCNGVSDPPYYANALNIFISLSAIGNKVAFHLVSGNLCGASLRHMQRLACKVCLNLFIYCDSTGIKESLSSYIIKMQVK
jgi:hypothetical protein